MRRNRPITEQTKNPITKMAKDLAELAAERSRGNKEVLIPTPKLMLSRLVDGFPFD
jgi:hypothetical protein